MLFFFFFKINVIALISSLTRYIGNLQNLTPLNKKGWGEGDS